MTLIKTIKEVAKDYLKNGLSVLPIHKEGKKPLIKWTPFQTKLPTHKQVDKWNFGKVAIVGGKVSGNLEFIDIDLKNDIDDEFEVSEYFADLKDFLGDEIYKTLIIEKSPSGGYHIIYRCKSKVAGSTILAHNKNGNKPIIETRGEGGYCIIYPSKGYELEQGNFENIPILSKDERKIILDTAKTFCQKPKAKPKKKTTTKKVVWDDLPYDFQMKKIEICVKGIEQKGTDIVSGYSNWINVGFGFANELGEQGRTFFHRISSVGSGYDSKECDKQYTACLNAGKTGKTATLATFFKFCNDNGIRYIDNLRKNAKGTIIKGDAGDGVKIEFTQLEKEDLKKEKFKQQIEQFERYISDKELKYNEITHHVESNNKNITDNDVNSYFVDLKFSGCTFNKDFVASYIYSDRTEKYNPIKSFLDSLKEVKHNNEVEELMTTLKVKNPNRLKFLKKWLCSIIASAYGQTSELVLVLTGEQGNGKTEFFTRLFPSELQRFFTIDKLDRDKDSDILMTNKLLILDDEFGGKSKKDAKRFKALVSQSKFTVRKPFGRIAEDLRRLAVLCGTSNNTDVINDNTGNRRIIPIELISRDFKKSDSIDRKNLFAQLVQLYFKEGESSFKLNKEEMLIIKELSEDYQTTNVEKEFIDIYFSIPQSEIEGCFMSSTEVADYIKKKTDLNISPIKIGQQLAAGGFSRKRINKTRGWIVVKNIL